MEKQIVIFKLADSHYGVEIAIVESIIKIQPITRIPQAPVFVEGVINLRGKILPIVNLRSRFNLPPRETDKDSRIVVVTMDNAGVGMVVDGVSEVLTILDSDIEPIPRLVETIDEAFITGIAKLDGRLVILLDLSAVLSLEERSALELIPTSFT